MTHLTRVAYRDDAAPKSILVGEVITAQDDPRLHPACSMLIEPDTNLLRVMLLTIAQVLYGNSHYAERMQVSQT